MAYKYVALDREKKRAQTVTYHIVGKWQLLCGWAAVRDINGRRQVCYPIAHSTNKRPAAEIMCRNCVRVENSKFSKVERLEYKDYEKE